MDIGSDGADGSAEGSLWKMPLGRHASRRSIWNLRWTNDFSHNSGSFGCSEEDVTPDGTICADDNMTASREAAEDENDDDASGCALQIRADMAMSMSPCLSWIER